MMTHSALFPVTWNLVTLNSLSIPNSGCIKTALSPLVSGLCNTLPITLEANPSMLVALLHMQKQVFLPISFRPSDNGPPKLSEFTSEVILPYSLQSYTINTASKQFPFPQFTINIISSNSIHHTSTTPIVSIVFPHRKIQLLFQGVLLFQGTPMIGYSSLNLEAPPKMTEGWLDFHMMLLLFGWWCVMVTVLLGWAHSYSSWEALLTIIKNNEQSYFFIFLLKRGTILPNMAYGVFNYLYMLNENTNAQNSTKQAHGLKGRDDGWEHSGNVIKYNHFLRE